jgi:hypothetical protein
MRCLDLIKVNVWLIRCAAEADRYDAGGFIVRDANKQTLAYPYSRENESDARSRGRTASYQLSPLRQPQPDLAASRAEALECACSFGGELFDGGVNAL